MRNNSGSRAAGSLAGSISPHSCLSNSWPRASECRRAFIMNEACQTRGARLAITNKGSASRFIGIHCMYRSWHALAGLSQCNAANDFWHETHAGTIIQNALRDNRWMPRIPA